MYFAINLEDFDPAQHCAVFCVHPFILTYRSLRLSLSYHVMFVACRQLVLAKGPTLTRTRWRRFRSMFPPDFIQTNCTSHPTITCALKMMRLPLCTAHHLTGGLFHSQRVCQPHNLVNHKIWETLTRGRRPQETEFPLKEGLLCECGSRISSKTTLGPRCIMNLRF